MRNKLFHHMSVLSMLLILTSFLEAQMSVDLGTIKKSLVCTCECNMTVDACEGSMACKSAENLALEATGLINKAITESEILSTFVKRYGEQILSAPVKEGFNLIAWILPFTTFILTGLGIVIMLRKWIGQSLSNSVFKKDDNPAIIDLKYEEQLNEALNSLD